MDFKEKMPAEAGIFSLMILILKTYTVNKIR